MKSIQYESPHNPSSFEFDFHQNPNLQKKTLSENMQIIIPIHCEKYINFLTRNQEGCGETMHKLP